MGLEQTENGITVSLSGARLRARGSGALWWPERRTLVVSDLHLGKSERMARRGGVLLPPYEVQDTLARLETEVEALDPRCVVCLGDSFDDVIAARSLPDGVCAWLARLASGRRWAWVEGNHDPALPVAFGTVHESLCLGPLVFRHIARPGSHNEVSGHYHPKAVVHARGRQVSRPCFLLDGRRMILPAFGTYTGGLRCTDLALSQLMRPDARAILTGPVPHMIPQPGQAA